MSDRPDFTANTALNAVADTLDNLPVSIDAQTLGSLAVDIAAQSAGDIDINLNSNSVGSISTIIDGQTGDVDIRFSSQTGNVDINFQDQTGGVESGKEFAARQGNTFARDADRTVASGGQQSVVLFDNTTGGSVVLESVTIASYSDFTDNCRVLFSVNAGSTGSRDVEVSLTPVTAPLVFDPGIRMSTAGDIAVLFENNAASSSILEATAVFREV